ILEKGLTDSFFAKNLQDVLWFPEISLLSAIDKEDSEPSEERRLGILFHYLMELSHDLESAEFELMRIYSEGQLTSENLKLIKNWLIKAYSNNELQSLLSKGTSMSERT
ncbi:MAG: hypothetical protein ACK476_12420, partial [Fluviicola sp.]